MALDIRYILLQRNSASVIRKADGSTHSIMLSDSDPRTSSYWFSFILAAGLNCLVPCVRRDGVSFSNLRVQRTKCSIYSVQRVH